MGCISLLRAWKSKLGFGDTGNQSSSTKEHEILSHGKITNANQRYIAADEVRNKRPNSVSSEKKRVKQTDAVTPSSPHGKIIPSQPASPAQTPSHHIPQILTNGLLTPPAIDQPEGSKNHKRTHTGSSAGSNRSSGHSPCSLTLNGPAEGEGDLSDVKASSIRSYGLEARNQLSEPELACKSDCLSLVDGISKLANDYNKHDTLEENLYGARIEWPKKMQTHFIPADALVQLVTAESIQRELEKCSVHCPPNKTVSDIAKETWEDASKLFATLVCLNKQHTIAEFLEEGFKDEDLPFIRSENTDPKAFPTLHSTLSKEKIVKCMSSNQWKLAQLEEFTLHQWWMMAPIFTRPDREVKFLVLEDQCPLPFTDDQEQGDQRQAGGYSCVWPVRIHSAHQRLVPISDDQNEDLSFAIKRLHSSAESDFRAEVEMLVAFSKHTNPHLIQLLATYQHRGSFHLVFPRAKCNLRQYWKNTLYPQLTDTTTHWMLEQCTGIARGLFDIHEYRRSQSDRSPPLSNSLKFAALAPGADKDDYMFGRHGDIKPENLLYFEEGLHGKLLIADFGLMDFHGVLTRSAVLASNVTGSPTYEPPERQIPAAKISRAYDIWSLGCVYLEFITWIVCGWQKLDEFHNVRGLLSPEGVDDDTFYTINKQSVPPSAVVRQAVTKWILDLHYQPRCSQFIHDFLDLVEEEMLVVDPSKRIKCGPLNHRLKRMMEKSARNSEYLSKPVVRQPNRGKASSTEAMVPSSPPLTARTPSMNQAGPSGMVSQSATATAGDGQPIPSRDYRPVSIHAISRSPPPPSSSSRKSMGSAPSGFKRDGMTLPGPPYASPRDSLGSLASSPPPSPTVPH